MDLEKLSKDKNNDNQNNISNGKLKNIKSNFTSPKIYDNLEKRKNLIQLNIIKNTKSAIFKAQKL